MAGLRTTTGCWTCRIRRKKCDDVQPSCGPCTFRQITCHGYGPKPGWMDCADDQKAEIERIKQAVSQNFRSRRAFRVSKKHPAPSRANPSVSDRRRDATPNSSLKQQVGVLDENASGIGEFQLESVGPSSESPPYIHPGSEAPSDNGPMKGQKHIHYTSPGGTLWAYSKAVEQKVYPFSFHAGAVPAENEHDLEMIMNYLDHIFPLQYYFYRPSIPERGRGWLLSILLRAKSSYFTTLAFSSLCQLIFVYNGDSVMQQKLSVDFDRYHTRALSELQVQLDVLPTSFGHDHLKLGVEILACMLQLMSIEVFRETKEYTGWKDDWEVHLQGAEMLLFVIGTGLRTSSANSPASNSSDENSALQLGDARDPIALPLNEIAGLDFFIKAYIWGDVFRCASTGSNKSNEHHFHYLAYLEEDRILLNEVMGCRNWAMIVIKETSNLESWKKEMQGSRTLSIPELSRKAAKLESRLRDGLENLMRDQEILTTYEQECNLVTEVYALSALTYLSIVVSGSSHLLAEVRSSVTKTLEALKALPSHLLIRISWAYCVAGCMAEESQEQEFRQLLSDASEKGHLLGTLWNGLEIMEEFWILRDDLEFMQTANRCAWALAMDSLGAKILLI